MLVHQSEVRDRIADAIAALPEREKLVVALYYYENLTLREIGEVLGVTESRVSQLHTKAVLRLRSKLAGELELNWAGRHMGDLPHARMRPRSAHAPRRRNARMRLRPSEPAVCEPPMG